MLRVGLNPYGLTYTLGLQGLGTPRANARATGLPQFVTIAGEVGARCLEIDWRWLLPMTPAAITALGDDLRGRDVRPIVSAWLLHTPGEDLDDAIRVTETIGADLLRLHLTPVLEGARASHGRAWDLMIEHARRTLGPAATKAGDAGLSLAIENHQDLGSEELLAISAEAGSNVGIVLDTGNPFAVGEDPVAFTRRAAGRIRHVHLKDYQAQFTDDGFKLVRCAIGDGCVPLVEMMTILATGREGELTASLEPAALEARHIRLFNTDWWSGYPPRDARELALALRRLRHRHLPEDADIRTPWERHSEGDELIDYERRHLLRSVEHMRSLGWM